MKSEITRNLEIVPEKKSQDFEISYASRARVGPLASALRKTSLAQYNHDNDNLTATSLDTTFIRGHNLFAAGTSLCVGRSRPHPQARCGCR